MSKKDKKIVYIYLSLALLVVLGIFLMRDSIFGESDKGNIVIKDAEAGSLIFLDNKERKRVNKDEAELKLKRIDSGFHSVLVSRDGYWPWLKDFELGIGENLILSPFLLPQNTNGLIIPADDEEYQEILNKIRTVKVPSFENKKLSADSKVAIWVDKGTLYVEWLGQESERPDYFCNEFGCHSVLVSLGIGGEIRNVEFYKKRNDVFIVSFAEGVFAIEADPTDNQNFQPIFEGEAPQFILGDDTSIYIKDDLLMQVLI